MAFSQLDRKYKYLQKQENLDYSKGFTTYIANDVVPENQLVYATDTRISTLGRQKTRQGCDFYSVPAGETQDQAVTSATGAADKSLGITTWLAQKFTAGATGRLARLDLELKNAASATGPIIVELHADNSGSPAKTALAQSSVPASSLTGAYAYLSARYIEAPQVVSGTVYWIVAYIQSDGSNTYAWNSTTTATTAMTSANSGTSWSATNYALHFKTFVSTDSPLLGHYRAYKSDGTKVTLIAYKEAGGTTAVATVNDNTGALTAIKTGLSSSATRYEFTVMNDVVIYVNGFDAPRKWDFTTEAALGGSPAVASDLLVHKNQLFLILASDPTRLNFSDLGNAESYTPTNFLYVPAPKSPDPITKCAVLNDNMYIFTRKTKWALTGADITSMVLRKAPGVKGTASPRSVQVTLNHIYFASDDNFYRFNGTTDQALSQPILDQYLGIANFNTIAGLIHDNRYYVWYTPSGGSQNSQCFVYNVNFGSMESTDLAAYINQASEWDGAADSGQMVQGSSLVGALYYGEQPSNSYNNLGRALSWELRTKYDHFGQPGTNKHVKRWYPRFTATQGNYAVNLQYDKDFANTPTNISLPLQGSGYILGSVTPTLGNFTLGKSALIDPHETIPGMAHYTQRRYQRVGVNNPVEFLGDTVYFYIRRPR